MVTHFPEKCVSLAKVYFDGMIKIHEKRSDELFWSETKDKCPSEEEYIETRSTMAKGILEMLVGFMAILGKDGSAKKENFEKLIQLQSVYMQVNEDYHSIMELCVRAFDFEKLNSIFNDIFFCRVAMPTIFIAINSPFPLCMPLILRPHFCHISVCIT